LKLEHETPLTSESLWVEHGVDQIDREGGRENGQGRQSEVLYDRVE